MKLYLIAGEASGDLHGSNLIKALRRLSPQTECRVWGGDLMQAAGGELVKHYRDLAYMGFVEVAKNIRTIMRNFAFCKRDILTWQPDALVLIDYPGFNLRMAKWAKKQGIRVIYYISPQIWAWHRSRVFEIRKNVDKMLVILPFETDFYKHYGVEAEYVGHPLLDAITDEPPLENREKEPLIALLPGSRRQEVRRILPPMLDTAAQFPDYSFEIAAAPGLPPELYKNLLNNRSNVRIAQGNSYDLLRRAQYALVKSGTSTLETALFNVPQVVCYAGNPVSYQIAKRLVEVKYISLVNLIMDAPLIKELIQHELTSANLAAALRELMQPEKKVEIISGYRRLRQKLGTGGASERAAKIILNMVG